jgi:hypothetical protein
MLGDEKKRYFNWKWFVVLVIVAVVAWAIWAMFFSYATCKGWDCFNGKLEDCSKTKFIGSSDEMIFEYVIRGSDDGECEVSVELLQGELNNQDSIKLEGHKMTCMLPEGVVMIPESNIGKCSGLLKEGLQDLVIKKLHTYLVQNLGQLNLEMIDVSGVV